MLQHASIQKALERRVATANPQQSCSVKLCWCQQEEVPDPKAESTPSEVPVLLAPRELADDALLPNISLLSLSSPIAARTEVLSQ